MESLERAKNGLALLKQAGMKKLNFAGGEPFLQPEFVGELMKYCKEVLRLESVSVVLVSLNCHFFCSKEVFH